MSEEIQGQAPIPAGPEPAGITDPAPEPERTFSLSEVKALRDEAASRRRELREREAELQALKDAQKTDTERLTETAGRVPGLEAALAERDERLAANEGIFAEEIAASKKALEALDKSLFGLLPENLTPAVEWRWLNRALAKAQADAVKRQGLPPAGGRNPGAGNGKQEPTDAERAAHLQHYATRF